jgi:alpha-L-arabinofuranosidase
MGEINVSGGTGGPRQAQLITLSSGRLADNNSLERPTKVAPVSGSLAVAGNHFSYQFPPNSLTIVRIPIQ